MLWLAAPGQIAAGITEQCRRPSGFATRSSAHLGGGLWPQMSHEAADDEETEAEPEDAAVAHAAEAYAAAAAATATGADVADDELALAETQKAFSLSELPQAAERSSSTLGRSLSLGSHVLAKAVGASRSGSFSSLGGGSEAERSSGRRRLRGGKTEVVEATSRRWPGAIDVDDQDKEDSQLSASPVSVALGEEAAMSSPRPLSSASQHKAKNTSFCVVASSSEGLMADVIVLDENDAASKGPGQRRPAMDSQTLRRPPSQEEEAIEAAGGTSGGNSSQSSEDLCKAGADPGTTSAACTEGGTTQASRRRARLDAVETDDNFTNEFKRRMLFIRDREQRRRDFDG
eukprot:TRINITY_DN61160_c0_g1_i1.p2 TRINITY_DN61160_c0_g1~~TRINITY_DN61160_c0_g1_i1.p2  ORF type:complete len:345 (+),score=99.13 TRINITY_DN61160_c0_g1_i1:103-1137(+)